MQPSQIKVFQNMSINSFKKKKIQKKEEDGLLSGFLTPHTSFYLCANRPLRMTELCTAFMPLSLKLRGIVDSSVMSNSVLESVEILVLECTNSTSVSFIRVLNCFLVLERSAAARWKS